MTELIATVGLQASGKTTWARAWVDEDPEHRIRVERDDIRRMIGNGFVKANEKFVIDIRNNLIENGLKTGRSVVVSDTNLPWRTLRELRTLALTNGAEFNVQDFTDVSVDECVRRDLRRSYGVSGAYVGERVIRDFHDRYLRGKGHPYPLPPEDAVSVWEKYVADPAKDSAVIVDIDGTLAKMTGRNPYDWGRVFEDRVNEPVANHVRDLVSNPSRSKVQVILLSGRDSAAREETVRWLDFHEIPYDELYMRAEGDTTRDDRVKYNLFNDHVRNRFNVLYVLDDRDQVVRMWRDLGLSCWQVDYGNF